MIAAEIQANNIKVQELVNEEGLKTGQNVAAGVAGNSKSHAHLEITENQQNIGPKIYYILIQVMYLQLAML